MKYYLNRIPNKYDGLPLMESSPGDAIPKAVTLRHLMQIACINADLTAYSTGEQKWKIAQLLERVSNPEDIIVDIVAEDVCLLKELAGKQMTVVAIGAFYKALENPGSENEPA